MVVRSAPVIPLLVSMAVGCARATPTTPVEVPPVEASLAVEPVTTATVDASTTDAGGEPAEADGDDDPADTGTGAIPASGHFERVGRPPLALRRVCDLTPFAGGLYAAHAIEPLGIDGATITRYDPDDAKHPFKVAFDWNRPGEPTQGGGAGQGFLRVHAIDGRLMVPDSDPPYAGFGIADRGTEGFVFLSDPSGAFAPPRAPHYHPPATAAVLPRAYHVLDVARFRGRYYASTGSVPPGERAWSGPSPGALHVANDDLSRFTYEVDYPYPWQNGVWRLTFLVRFRGRLFAGIEDYDGRDPNDYVVFDPPKGATTISHADARPVRVTETGGAQTVRWYADHGRLYWIAVTRGGVTSLRVTEDGETWKVVALPPDAGRPTDLTRFRDGLVVLAEHGLYRLDLEGEPRPIARIEGKTPFPADDFLCAAPLAVYRSELYAGGQRDGSLYRLSEEAPAP
jgi:hypothetical protein